MRLLRTVRGPPRGAGRGEMPIVGGRLAALFKGTVFFNGAGLAFPNLAGLGATPPLPGLPAKTDVYVTDPRREVSVSPHSDAQNLVFSVLV